MMGNNRRFLVGSVLLLAMTATAPVAAEGHRVEPLQEAVQGWASDIGAPGMTAQIVDADGIVSSASTGFDGRGEPVDAATPFVWGSVSKQLAAATVLSLEREGRIADSTPVVDVVPHARELLADPSVTVGDLVHHTSGLPHDVTVTDDWTRRGSATEAVGSMTAPDGMSERGTFRYSSLNYLVLQSVIEQCTDGAYADALDDFVLEPAGATATITDPDEYIRDIPPGHVPFFGTAKLLDVGVDAAGLGYGYLAGSIDELGRYASWRLAQLQNGESEESGVPTGEAGTEYRDGLYRQNIGGKDVWWHSGAVPGYYTYVAFVPAEGKAMVLATNRYGEIEADRVAAVGRNLTTLVLDGSTTDLPGSSAFMVLGTVLGLAALLLAGAGWVGRRVAIGRSRERSRTGAAVRILIAVALGGAGLVGTYIGLPSVVGASAAVMWLWAPDVAVAFWTLLGAVALAALVLVVSEVLSYRRRDRGCASDQPEIGA